MISVENRKFPTLLYLTPHLLTTLTIHHTFTIPGSKLAFSTSLFHHSLLSPTWSAFSDYTGPDLYVHLYLPSNGSNTHTIKKKGK